MAFNIVAQIQLQAPGNLNQVVNQINGQLKNINASINLKIPTGIQSAITGIATGINTLNANLNKLNAVTNTSNTNISGLNTTLNTLTTTFNTTSSASRKITTSITEAHNAFEEFGRSAGLSTRRFLAFSLISNQIVSAFSNIGTAVRSALEYDREFIKLSQVGEAFKSELVDLNKEIGRLSSNFGTSSQDLVRSAVTLRQAGFSIDEVRISLQTLAKASLAPSFGGDANKLSEGLIAIRQQFRLTAEQADLAINSINAVANAFAVESKDIIEAVQRSGGAFRSIGGDLNEFQALFTSVRATTRESAESIATGLRTIFTRLQRPELVSSLEELGINLRYTRQEAEALGNVSLERQFVGGYEAVRRLSTALQGLPSTDPRYAQIIEDISGNRQISKIIPLLQQNETAQNALNVAQASGLSLTVSADIAQQNFLVNLNKLKESLLTLTRTIVGSSGFSAFTDNILKLGNSLAFLGNQLAPIIPLLTTLATIRLASGAASFLTGFGAGFTKPSFRSQGGPIGMARGGVVPGSGNSDSVPANLMPGEFVIKKPSAQAIGYDTLHAMNGGRVGFANGGSVSDIRRKIFKTTADFLDKTGVNLSKGYRQLNLYDTSEIQGIAGKTAKAFYESGTNIIGLDANSSNIESLFIHEALHGIDKLKGMERGFTKLSYTDIPETDISEHIGKLRGYILPRTVGLEDRLRNYLSDSSEILAHSGQGILGNPEVPNSVFAKVFTKPEIAAMTQYSAKNIIPKLITNDNINNYPPLKPNSRLFKTGFKLFASGGASTDIVPAMLTPGEFVVNSESAKRIGYSNLHSMNRTGQIQKFAKGGIVNRANGTPPDFLNGESAEDIFYRLGAQFGIFTGLRNANNNGSPFLLGNVRAPLGNPFQYDSPIGPQRASFGNLGNILGGGGTYGPFPSESRFRSPISAPQFPINPNGPSSDPIVRLLTQIAGNTGKTASSAASTTTTNTETGEIGGLTKGTAFLAALGIFAASYAAQLADQLGGTAQNAAQNGGSGFIRGRAISGAISGGLPLATLGFQFGGPIGAGIGGLLGSGLGAIGGIQQARSELSGARIEESQRTLSDTLRILSNRNEATIGVAQGSVISTSIREAFDEIREKSITDNQRFYIFGTNTSAADTQNFRDRRIFAQSQVDSVNRVLTNTLSAQARQLGGTSQLSPQDLRNRLSPNAIASRLTQTQDELIRFLSVGSGESRGDILERFSRQFTQTTLAERVRVNNVNNATSRDTVIIQFNRLGSVLERVGNDFENLGRSLEVNSALFEGRFASTQRRIPGAANLFGVGDASENAAIISAFGGAIGGADGARFTEFGNAFDGILRNLFESVASNFNQFNPLEGPDIATNVRNQIESQLGGRNNLNTSQRSILSDIESNLGRLDSDRLRQFIQSGNREGLNRELTQGINFGQNFDQIIRQFQDAVSQFDSSLQNFERRNIELGNVFSQGLITQRTSAQFNRISGFIGQGIDPTALQGLLPLNEANGPALGRLRFLSQQIGAAGTSPDAIAQRQRVIQDSIVAVEQERNNINNPRDNRFRQLTIELAGLQRQSAQATQALTDLANATTNVARQERLNALVRNRDNRISFAERILTSSPAELSQRRLAFRQFGNLVGSGGNISDLPFQTRGEIFSVLRGGGSIPITQLGATPQVIQQLSRRYGLDASKLTAEQVITQEIRRDPQTAEFARQDEDEIDRLIREIRQGNEEAVRAQNLIYNNQKRLQDDFFTRLNAGFDRFFNIFDRQKAQGAIQQSRANIGTLTGNLASAGRQFNFAQQLGDLGITNQNQLTTLITNRQRLLNFVDSDGLTDGAEVARLAIRGLGREEVQVRETRNRFGLPIARTQLLAPTAREQVLQDLIRRFGLDEQQQGAVREVLQQTRPGLNEENFRQQLIRNLTDVLNPIVRNRVREENNLISELGVNRPQAARAAQLLQNPENLRLAEGFNNGNRLENAGRAFNEAFDAYTRANEELNRLTQNLQNLNQQLNPQPIVPQAQIFAPAGGGIQGVPPVPIPGSNIDAIVNGVFPVAAAQSGQPGGLAGIFNAAQNLVAQQVTASVSDAGRNFAVELNPFIEALKNFPQELTGSFTHNVNLNINGAEALSGIESTMKEYVIEQVKDVMRNYIRDNLFEAGQLV